MQPEILLMTIIAALLQDSHASEFAYFSPAEATYLNNKEFQDFLQYSGNSEKIETQPATYATAQEPAVASVPVVKHVPTVSNIPVTKVESQPAFLEKQLDVIKPAVSTRKVEIRRPAVQKQIFEIEERILVRPIGSVMVEVEQPNELSANSAEISKLNQDLFELSSSQASTTFNAKTNLTKNVTEVSHIQPTNRTSIRRIVITSPIETIQEGRIIEPVTKVEQISIRQPTLLKTLRLDNVQVHGSVPVVEKTLPPFVEQDVYPVYGYIR
ncbi:uncharacterized protein LOC143177274 [Calliopsis andreniformis]|uniref:uncharacterized protein LOC143177274 n=1 Tax=Calliopsis andreniformis TaxID=337506 RepID=UPI003FCD387D